MLYINLYSKREGGRKGEEKWGWKRERGDKGRPSLETNRRPVLFTRCVGLSHDKNIKTRVRPELLARPTNTRIFIHQVTAYIIVKVKD